MKCKWNLGNVSRSLKPAGLLATAAATLAFLCSSADATDRYWSDSSGNWADPSCWGGTVPTRADAVYIFDDGMATINSPDAVCNTLYLGNMYTSGSVSMESGSFAFYYNNVGYQGPGYFSLSGGTCTNNLLYIGLSDLGTFNQSGGIFTSISPVYVGRTSTGVFTQTGGTHTCYSVVLGYGSAATGSYYLNGGVLATNTISRGSGSASFYVGGGTLKLKSSTTISLPISLTGNGGDANVNTQSYAVTLSGALSGNGGLKKLGSGKLVLTGSDTYSGDTVVSAGILEFTDGNLSNTAFDVAGGSLVVRGAAIYAEYFGYIAAAYNGGLWNGDSYISSSLCKTNPNYNIGILTGDELFERKDTYTYNGVTLGSNDLVIFASMAGDLDLDGDVDDDDYGIFNAFYQEGVDTPGTYGQGDLNYDGVINEEDLAILNANY